MKTISKRRWVRVRRFVGKPLFYLCLAAALGVWGILVTIDIAYRLMKNYLNG